MRDAYIHRYGCMHIAYTLGRAVPAATQESLERTTVGSHLGGGQMVGG